MEKKRKTEYESENISERKKKSTKKNIPKVENELGCQNPLNISLW